MQDQSMFGHDRRWRRVAAPFSRSGADCPEVGPVTTAVGGTTAIGVTSAVGLNPRPLPLPWSDRRAGPGSPASPSRWRVCTPVANERGGAEARSEEHTSELQSLMRISYDVF